MRPSEGDREAATPPSSRTTRRRRILVGGSAALAVALVATGVGLLNRPQDPAALKPATRTTTQVSATPTRTATAVSTSRVLTLSKIHSVRVTLRPEGGRPTVGGGLHFDQ